MAEIKPNSLVGFKNKIQSWYMLLEMGSSKIKCRTETENKRWTKMYYVDAKTKKAGIMI